MTSDYDVVVIGAGAAGIAAASFLHRQCRTLVLEARDRVGGRAHTVEPIAGLPLDQGCGWLHSADENPLVGLAEVSGFTVDRTPPAWDRQYRDLGFGPDDQHDFDRAFEAFEMRLEEVAQRGWDGPASACFQPGNRWNALMDAVSSYYNGCEFDRVSVQDYDAYRDSGVNWRIREGYGTAVESFARGLDIRLNCAVAEIAHAGNGLRIATDGGDIHARRAIITVPTPHLAEERLILPASHRSVVEAAAALPLGLANKVFLELANPAALTSETHLFGRTDTVATGSYYLRPLERAYIEVFFGGRHADALEAEGQGAATAFAIEELRALLGTDFTRGLTPLGETAWRRDPLALGSYSHAEPGQAAARRRLAQSPDERIFIAGEGTHPTAFSTAHGAWETGLTAARKVLTTLNTA